MIKLIKKSLWFLYYIYDYIRSYPYFNEVRMVDERLSSRLEDFFRESPHSDIIVVLATFKSSPQNLYIEYLLKKLSSYSVVVVNNTTRKPYDVKKWGGKLIWIDRPNFLRDIGAYRLAIKSMASSKFPRPRRVILMNDSYFILRDEFFNNFNRDFDFDVTSDSFSRIPIPHLRSYWLSVRSDLIDPMNNYLKKLSSVKSRYAAVNYGELGLSEKVFKKCTWGIILLNNTYHHLDGFHIKVLEKVKLMHSSNRSQALDPYQISNYEDIVPPRILKREVVEKNLATAAECIAWIMASDLPESVKSFVVSAVALPKAKMTLIYRIKRIIGEI